MNPLQSLLWIADTSKRVVQENTKRTAKKELWKLTDVAQTSASTVQNLAQEKANPVGMMAFNKIQNLASIPKVSLDNSPFKFDNLLWQSQWWMPNMDFTKLWTTPINQQEFSQDISNVKNTAKDNIIDMIDRWWQLSLQKLKLATEDMDDEQFNQVLDILSESDVQVEWIDYNVPNQQPTQVETPLQWGIRRWASALWVDIWDWERLNPIWKVTELIDEQAQKIPVLSEQERDTFAKEKLWWFGVGMWWVPRMITNFPWSFLKTLTATARWVTNPIDTITWLVNLVTTEQWQQALADRYWSVDAFYRTMTEDPAGTASDILTVVWWWATIAGKWAKLAWLQNTAWKLSKFWATASNVADLWVPNAMWSLNAWVDTIWNKALRVWAKAVLAPTQPIKTITENMPNIKTKSIPWEVNFADRAIALYNWLDAQTVRKFKDNPDTIKLLDEWKITRESIKGDLIDAVDQVKTNRNEIWGAYQKVYESPKRFSSQDIINDINNTLEDQGITIEWWKIKSFDTTKLSWLSAESKNALKSKYNDTISTLNSKKDLSVEELHNIRKDLYSTSYQDWFITKKAPWVEKVSNVIDERLKEIPWFAEADKWYREASWLLQEIKSNVLNKEWDFKWTLKALLWEKQGKRLDILEKHFPWLKDKIETLAAYDDYINTRTRKKVWLYEKAASWWWWALLWFWLWWPIWAAIWWIAWSFIKDFITDPKRFKNYIVKNAGKNIADKIELWTKLTPSENVKLKIALKQVEKNPDLSLPYKPEVFVAWEQWVTRTMWWEKTAPLSVSNGKRVITEINPKQWVKYTKNDIMEEIKNKRVYINPDDYKKIWLNHEQSSNRAYKDFTNALKTKKWGKWMVIAWWPWSWKGTALEKLWLMKNYDLIVDKTKWIKELEEMLNNWMSVDYYVTVPNARNFVSNIVNRAWISWRTLPIKSYWLDTHKEIVDLVNNMVDNNKNWNLVIKFIDNTWKVDDINVVDWAKWIRLLNQLWVDIKHIKTSTIQNIAKKSLKEWKINKQQYNNLISSSLWIIVLLGISNTEE